VNVDPHLFVILGGTGDLTHRKLVPSLYRILADTGIADRCILLGVAPSDEDDARYRRWVREALADAGVDDDPTAWCDENVYYERIGRDQASYAALRKRIEEIETERGLPGNRIFYLALPPPAFPTVIEGLAGAGLATGPGWTRLVVEKPFGTDLASARALNELVHRWFDESQIYRIDHYLGKETVRNLLAFRFANPMFESVWNRDRVESVEITVAEDIGIGSRGAYYESAGVVRDMIQNHLTQLLALVAMEPPTSFDAEKIRDEKVKVVEAVAPISLDDVVFGQYDAGTVDGVAVPAYRQEPGVDPDSKTPTFVALRLDVDTWRWQGVPFYLRTGKRLPKRLTQIAVTFQRPPLCIFHGRHDTCAVDPNVLLITLQPDEGFALRFNVKMPGETMILDTQALHFNHSEVYGRLPDAYQTLLLDVMQGDQTLFVRADEVDASWRLYDPLLRLEATPYLYPAGTWGPAAMRPSIALGDDGWTRR